MDFRLSAAEEAFRQSVRDWLDTALPAVFADPAQRAPRDAQQKIEASKAWQRTLFDGGWAGITWPREVGGRGATLVEQLLFNEACAAAGAPDSINLAVALGLVGPTLIACGTPAQRSRFLPRILRGEDIWCQGFSEPNAGSDLAGLTTRGEVRGDHIAVTGQKIWTSFAQYADWCILVVRTDPTAAKHRGLSFLLVDMRSPGITIRPLVEMTGEAWFNEVFFDEVRVPRDLVVGEIDKGWDVVITTLAHERGGAAPHARLRRELNALLDLARRQRRDADPGVRQQLAQLAVEVQLAKLTAYRNVSGIQRTGQPGPEGSILKLFWSEVEQRLMEVAGALLGPHASLWRDDPRAVDAGSWARELLWTRSATIYAGTSEVQRNIIAQRVLGLPRN
ncbi:MAG: acyl-CoA dehydrogenase family protein [Deltaproteobacteria bacterium]|nr:acyl-CoA dehydrogenase family protein [Deltaproteobacteria bacterium]